MILTFDLVSRIIVSGAYLLYYLMWEFQIWCVELFWDGGMVHTILGHFYFDFCLISRFFVSGAYLLYYS